jgi:hypothetical protein
VNLTNIIRPANATTPSMTKTLNRERTNRSDKRRPDKAVETKNKIKNVMISKSKRVIRSHSENNRKAKERTTQIESKLERA